MVRETRYLLVGNLPDKVTEETLKGHFKRYGQIQSVKLQPKNADEDASSASATVAFMDIRSASKAHAAENCIESNVLRTDYGQGTTTGSAVTRTHEDPPNRPRTASQTQYNNTRTKGPEEGDTYGVGGGREYHYNRDGQQPYEPHFQQHYDENLQYPPRGRPREKSFSQTRGSFPKTHFDRNSQPPTKASQRQQPQQQFEGHRVPSEFGGDFDRPRLPGSPSRHGSRRKGSVSISRSASRSKSSSSSSSTYSSSSGSSHSHSRSRSRSKSSTRESPRPPASVCSKVQRNDPQDNNSDKQSSTTQDSRGNKNQPHGIIITDLPLRSSTTSLRDGLFHEYKKIGKVTSVQVIGQLEQRYAIVSFRKAVDATKALEGSQNKIFFAKKVTVAPHEGAGSCDNEIDENEFRPPESEFDEYHSKATRTLFVGNLDKEITNQELMDQFKKFGEVIDVDIKRQGAISAYAFVQYSDISSVVKALWDMEEEQIGGHKIKLGFGKSMPTCCIWLDSLAETCTEKVLFMHFKRFGEVSHCVLDKMKGRALVYFSTVENAQYAVNEMKTRMLCGNKVQIDFASRDCQQAFFEKMEKSGQLLPGERPDERGGQNYRQQQGTEYFSKILRERGGSQEGRGTYGHFKRGRGFPNWPSRGNRGRGTFRGRSRSFETVDEFGNRKQRTFDDFSPSGSFQDDDSYEKELREYGFSQRERRERGGQSPSGRDEQYCSPSFDDKYGNKEYYDEKYVENYHGSESPVSERSFYKEGIRSRELGGKSSLKGRRDQSLDSPGHQRGDSPTASRSHSPATSSRDRRPKEYRPCTPPTPTEEEPPMYRKSSRAGSPVLMDFKVQEVKRKSSQKEEKNDSDKESVRLARTTLTSRVGNSLRKEFELIKSDRMSNRKRTLDDVYPIDSVKVKKMERKLSGGLSMAKVLESKSTRNADLAAELARKIGLEYAEKQKAEAKIFSKLPRVEKQKMKELLGTASAVDDGSSMNENDITKLEQDKLLLLEQIKLLDETGSTSDNDSLTALDDSKKNISQKSHLVEKDIKDRLKKFPASRFGSTILLQKKIDPYERDKTRTIDATQSCRKQMEAQRLIEKHKDIKKVEVFKAKPSKVDHESIYELENESQKEYSAEYVPKKRKIMDGATPVSGIKHRSYRTKRDDDFGSSDEERIAAGFDRRHSHIPLSLEPVKNYDPVGSLMSPPVSGHSDMDGPKSIFGSLHPFQDPSHKTPNPKGSADSLKSPDYPRSTEEPPKSAPPHKDEPYTYLRDIKVSPIKDEVLLDPRHDSKREGPLSLPLPKFALLHGACPLSPIHSSDRPSQAKLPSPSFSPQSSSSKSQSPMLSPVLNSDASKSGSDFQDFAVPLEAAKVSPLEQKDKPSYESLPADETTPDHSSKQASPPVRTSEAKLSIDERIKMLDEKLRQSVTTAAAKQQLEAPPSPALVSLYAKFKVKKRVDISPVPVTVAAGEVVAGDGKPEPSDIMKVMLSRSSIFDQDTKRLEQIHEKYDPKKEDVAESDVPPTVTIPIRTKAAAKEMPSLQEFQQDYEKQFPTKGELSRSPSAGSVDQSSPSGFESKVPPTVEQGCDMKPLPQPSPELSAVANVIAEIRLSPTQSVAKKPKSILRPLNVCCPVEKPEADGISPASSMSAESYKRIGSCSSLGSTMTSSPVLLAPGSQDPNPIEEKDTFAVPKQTSNDPVDPREACSSDRKENTSSILGKRKQSEDKSEKNKEKEKPYKTDPRLHLSKHASTTKDAKHETESKDLDVAVKKQKLSSSKEPSSSGKNDDKGQPTKAMKAVKSPDKKPYVSTSEESASKKESSSKDSKSEHKTYKRPDSKSPKTNATVKDSSSSKDKIKESNKVKSHRENSSEGDKAKSVKEGGNEDNKPVKVNRSLSVTSSDSDHRSKSKKDLSTDKDKPKVHKSWSHESTSGNSNVSESKHKVKKESSLDLDVKSKVHKSHSSETSMASESKVKVKKEVNTADSSDKASSKPTSAESKQSVDIKPKLKKEVSLEKDSKQKIHKISSVESSTRKETSVDKSKSIFHKAHSVDVNLDPESKVKYKKENTSEDSKPKVHKSHSLESALESEKKVKATKESSSSHESKPKAHKVHSSESSGKPLITKQTSHESESTKSKERSSHSDKKPKKSHDDKSDKAKVERSKSSKDHHRTEKDKDKKTERTQDMKQKPATKHSSDDVKPKADPDDKQKTSSKTSDESRHHSDKKSKSKSDRERSDHKSKPSRDHSKSSKEKDREEKKTHSSKKDTKSSSHSKSKEVSSEKVKEVKKPEKNWMEEYGFEPYISMYDNVKRRSCKEKEKEKGKEKELEDVRKSLDKLQKCRQKKAKLSLSDHTESSDHVTDEDDDEDDISTVGSKMERDQAKEKSRKKRANVIDSSSSEDEFLRTPSISELSKEINTQRGKTKTKSSSKKASSKHFTDISEDDFHSDSETEYKVKKKSEKPTDKDVKSKPDDVLVAKEIDITSKSKSVEKCALPSKKKKKPEKTHRKSLAEYVYESSERDAFSKGITCDIMHKTGNQECNSTQDFWENNANKTIKKESSPPKTEEASDKLTAKDHILQESSHKAAVPDTLSIKPDPPVEDSLSSLTDYKVSLSPRTSLVEFSPDTESQVDDFSRVEKIIEEYFPTKVEEESQVKFEKHEDFWSKDSKLVPSYTEMREEESSSKSSGCNSDAIKPRSDRTFSMDDYDYKHVVKPGQEDTMESSVKCETILLESSATTNLFESKARLTDQTMEDSVDSKVSTSKEQVKFGELFIGHKSKVLDSNIFDDYNKLSVMAKEECSTQQDVKKQSMKPFSVGNKKKNAEQEALKKKSEIYIFSSDDEDTQAPIRAELKHVERKDPERRKRIGEGSFCEETKKSEEDDPESNTKHDEESTDKLSKKHRQSKSKKGADTKKVLSQEAEETSNSGVLKAEDNSGSKYDCEDEEPLSSFTSVTQSDEKPEVIGKKKNDRKKKKGSRSVKDAAKGLPNVSADDGCQFARKVEEAANETDAKVCSQHPETFASMWGNIDGGINYSAKQEGDNQLDATSHQIFDDLHSTGDALDKWSVTTKSSPVEKHTKRLESEASRGSVEDKVFGVECTNAPISTDMQAVAKPEEDILDISKSAEKSPWNTERTDVVDTTDKSEDLTIAKVDNMDKVLVKDTKVQSKKRRKQKSGGNKKSTDSLYDTAFIQECPKIESLDPVPNENTNQFCHETVPYAKPSSKSKTGKQFDENKKIDSLKLENIYQQEHFDSEEIICVAEKSMFSLEFNQQNDDAYLEDPGKLQIDEGDTEQQTQIKFPTEPSVFMNIMEPADKGFPKDIPLVTTPSKKSTPRKGKGKVKKAKSTKAPKSLALEPSTYIPALEEVTQDAKENAEFETVDDFGGHELQDIIHSNAAVECLHMPSKEENTKGNRKKSAERRQRKARPAKKVNIQESLASSTDVETDEVHSDRIDSYHNEHGYEISDTNISQFESNAKLDSSLIEKDCFEDDMATSDSTRSEQEEAKSDAMSDSLRPRRKQNRKNYKVMDSGMATRSTPPRLRVSTSPKGLPRTTSPKQCSPKAAEISSPIVKLEKLPLSESKSAKADESRRGRSARIALLQNAKDDPESTNVADASLRGRLSKQEVPEEQPLGRLKDDREEIARAVESLSQDVTEPAETLSPKETTTPPKRRGRKKRSGEEMKLEETSADYIPLPEKELAVVLPPTNIDDEDKSEPLPEVKAVQEQDKPEKEEIPPVQMTEAWADELSAAIESISSNVIGINPMTPVPVAVPTTPQPLLTTPNPVIEAEPNAIATMSTPTLSSIDDIIDKVARGLLTREPRSVEDGSVLEESSKENRALDRRRSNSKERRSSNTSTQSQSPGYMRSPLQVKMSPPMLPHGQPVPAFGQPSPVISQMDDASHMLQQQQYEASKAVHTISQEQIHKDLSHGSKQIALPPERVNETQQISMTSTPLRSGDLPEDMSTKTSFQNSMPVTTNLLAAAPMIQLHSVGGVVPSSSRIQPSQMAIHPSHPKPHVGPQPDVATPLPQGAVQMPVQAQAAVGVSGGLQQERSGQPMGGVIMHKKHQAMNPAGQAAPSHMPPALGSNQPSYGHQANQPPAAQGLNFSNDPRPIVPASHPTGRGFPSQGGPLWNATEMERSGQQHPPSRQKCSPGSRSSPGPGRQAPEHSERWVSEAYGRSEMPPPSFMYAAANMGQLHQGLHVNLPTVTGVSQRSSLPASQKSPGSNNMKSPLPSPNQTAMSPPINQAAVQIGVVQGQPQTIPPKEASPTGQVIQRVPNPHSMSQQQQNAMVDSRPVSLPSDQPGTRAPPTDQLVPAALRSQTAPPGLQVATPFLTPDKVAPHAHLTPNHQPAHYQPQISPSGNHPQATVQQGHPSTAAHSRGHPVSGGQNLSVQEHQPTTLSSKAPGASGSNNNHQSAHSHPPSSPAPAHSHQQPGYPQQIQKIPVHDHHGPPVMTTSPRPPNLVSASQNPPSGHPTSMGHPAMPNTELRSVLSQPTRTTHGGSQPPQPSQSRRQSHGGSSGQSTREVAHSGHGYPPQIPTSSPPVSSVGHSLHSALTTGQTMDSSRHSPNGLAQHRMPFAMTVVGPSRAEPKPTQMVHPSHHQQSSQSPNVINGQSSTQGSHPASMTTFPPESLLPGSVGTFATPDGREGRQTLPGQLYHPSELALLQQSGLPFHPLTMARLPMEMYSPTSQQHPSYLSAHDGALLQAMHHQTYYQQQQQQLAAQLGARQMMERQIAAEARPPSQPGSRPSSASSQHGPPSSHHVPQQKVQQPRDGPTEIRGQSVTLQMKPHGGGSSGHGERPELPAGDIFGLQRYPVMWQGILALKNDNTLVQMHHISGSRTLAKLALPQISSDGTVQPLRIAQRMRLEMSQLEGVAKRMQLEADYCMLLALPSGRDHIDLINQTKVLTTGFIEYLSQKQAAGIVNVAAPGSEQPAYVVHIFPPCEFSQLTLERLSFDLRQLKDLAHLLIVIATV